MFSINLHFTFLVVLTTKTYLVLHFVVQFSEFLIPGKGLPSCYQSQIVQSKNIYNQLANVQLQVIRVHHVTSLTPMADEGTFLLPQSKQLAPTFRFPMDGSIDLR
jgi:hypothetical protein